MLERGVPAAVHGERHLTAVPEAQAYLETVAARLRAEQLDVSYHAHEAPEGDVARSIVEHAAEERPDAHVGQVLRAGEPVNLVCTIQAGKVTVEAGEREIYRWQGELSEETEVVVLLKTDVSKWDALRAAVRAQHPCQVPELLALPVDRGLDLYLSWLASEVVE